MRTKAVNIVPGQDTAGLFLLHREHEIRTGHIVTKAGHISQESQGAETVHKGKCMPPCSSENVCFPTVNDSLGVSFFKLRQLLDIIYICNISAHLNIRVY